MGKAREVVEAAYRASNAGDLEAMIKDYDDNATFWSPARPAGRRGKEQIREVSQALLTAFPGNRVTITNIIESGDWVVMEYMFEGTHNGPPAVQGGAIPATGKAVQSRGASVIEVRNGKIISERLYADSLDLMRQLGLMPAAATPT